jgi:hypothetical protein
MSYWLCRSNQNWALLPKYRPRRTAVSAVMERRPFKMSVIRPDGTPMSSASRLALNEREVNSRFSRRPGWAAGGMVLIFYGQFRRRGRHRCETRNSHRSFTVMAHWPLRFPLSLCRATLRSGLRSFSVLAMFKASSRSTAASKFRPRNSFGSAPSQTFFWSRNLRHDPDHGMNIVRGPVRSNAKRAQAPPIARPIA